jgi:hypothetical protein
MRVLSQKDRWVGEAITRVRVTYENWAGLTSGEIRIEPEYCRGPIRSRHVQLFANYAKEAFLTAVAVLHRGFFIRRPLFYFSRTGSVAFLSSRNPMKTGWRKRSSRVHSVNFTSQIIKGLTQTHRFISAAVNFVLLGNCRLIQTIQKAKAAFDQAQSVEERLLCDFTGVDFTNW